MAMPTTDDGSHPPMAMPAWAHHLSAAAASSAQLPADFTAVSSSSVPASVPQHPGFVNVNSFHAQHQLHHPHLGHPHQPQIHPQQQQRPQPQSQPPPPPPPQQQQQQQFGLYDQPYYNPPANQYASVPFAQAPVERQSYYPPPQLGQLPGPPAVQVPYDVASVSQPQPPPASHQSFTSNDGPSYFKKESQSPPNPPPQHAPTTPPGAGTHPQQTPIVQTPTMAAQVETATPGKMAKSTKSASGTPTRKSSQNAPSPKAGKKRSRQEADGGGEGEGSGEPEEPQKKRGRPRLAEGVEGRNDRRRGQIREAQRAYRNRKDNRITELEGQVERLEREKMDMSRDFGGVLDLLRSQGTAQTSAAIASRFDELRQKYPFGMQDYQDGDAQSVMSSNTGRDRYGHHTYARQTLGTISSASSDHQAIIPGGQIRPQVQGPNLSFGSSGASFYPPDTLSYEVIAQPTPENASFPQYAPDPRAPGNWIEQPPIPPHPQVFFQQVGAEQALVNTTLRNPDSSAADEATFGRRLQRRTLERALGLATMKNPPPDRFGAVFGFCLLVESREQIVTRLTNCLNAAQQGYTLNNWRHPFTNLGGIGFSTSYASSEVPTSARTDSQGYMEAYMPQHMTGFSMGPWNAQVESVKDTRLDKKQMQMNLPGFEGQFLDAQEAERYLLERGIFIPQGATLVDVEVSQKDFGDGPETGTAPANTAANNAFTTAFSTYAEFPQGTRAIPEEAITTMFSDNTTTGAANPDAMNPFLCPAVPLGSWTSTVPSDPKFKARIDVIRLVEELVNRSVCLGRAPGVRPKDIDRAVKIASGLYKAAD